MSSEPIIYDASALLVPGYTSDDIHCRREGEPLGYVPRAGDVIRYAMRHGPWPAGGGRLPDWPARDAQGDWSDPWEVLAVYERDGLTKYSLRPAGSRSVSPGAWIDLDWWIADLVSAASAVVVERIPAVPVVQELPLW